MSLREKRNCKNAERNGAENDRIKAFSCGRRGTILQSKMVDEESKF